MPGSAAELLASLSREKKLLDEASEEMPLASRAITEPDPESESPVHKAFGGLPTSFCHEEEFTVEPIKRPMEVAAAVEEGMRTPRMFSPSRGSNDAFGSDFLERVKGCSSATTIPHDGVSTTVTPQGISTSVAPHGGISMTVASHGVYTTVAPRAFSNPPSAVPSSAGGAQVRRPSPPHNNIFQHLYKESEARQRRWQARFEEKCRQEAEALHKQLQSTRVPRSFDAGAFSDWYEGQVDKYHSAQNNRQEKRNQEACRREREELAECSFSPRHLRKAPPSAARRGAASLTRPGVASNSRSFGASRTQKEESTSTSSSSAANQLVAEQALQVEELKKLEKKEKEILASAERAAAKELESAVEESKRKLEVFLKTAEGQDYLTTRKKSYMELNDGISEKVALREAREDLARASEVRLKQQAEATARHSVQGCLQLVQLERLKVARELIQLQRRCQSVMSKGDLPANALRGFDMQFVERMTNEAWYTKAKESAAKILNKGGSSQVASGTL